MIYSGILGTSYTQLGNFLLGMDIEDINDIIYNSDFVNSVTLLTYKGEEWVADRLAGVATDELYVGWGTGTGDLSKELTALFDENTEVTRSLATISTQENWPQDGSGRTISFIAKAVRTASEDIEITEAGLFDSDEDGNLLMQSTFDMIPLLAPDDRIIFTFALDPS